MLKVLFWVFKKSLKEVHNTYKKSEGFISSINTKSFKTLYSSDTLNIKTRDMYRMKLKSSKKIYNNYKSEYPENTIEKIKKGLEKIDLQLRYEEIEISSSGFSSYSGDLFLEDFGFNTTGKGVTSILSKASAYAEMAERLSSGFIFFYNLNSDIGEYYQIIEKWINREFLKGYEKNKKSKEVSYKNINKFFQDDFSLKQYNLYKENEIFDILVDSYSLIKKDYSKIPIHFIELLSGTNGLASGNTYEEAIVQGSCEIFERYAACKIISEKIECPTIDISTIKDEKIQNFIEMLNSLNIDVLIKDFSLCNSLPVVGVLFTNNNIKNTDNPLKKSKYYKMINPGSHLDLKEAIIRCLVERLQEERKEELMYRKEADELYDFWTETLNKSYKKSSKSFKNFYRQYYYRGDLSFLEKGEIVSFDDLNSIKNDDFLDDIKHIKNICIKNKWDILVVDCKHKVIDFPAVRVIIPPISTDANPHIRKFVELRKFEEQFDFIYGIKDLHLYFENNDWIHNKEMIKKLIKNLEDAISEDLFSYEFFLRRGPFYQCTNLFDILAFSNLAINRDFEALKFFKFLEKHKGADTLKLKYFNKMYNPNFDEKLYEKYIKLLENNEKTINYTFPDNPFNPNGDRKRSDKKIGYLLKKFIDSYFSN